MIHLPERYQPTGDFANGGFGNITFCKDTHLERFVAIKSIQKAQELNRLTDELSALMLMRSKHVVQIYDIIYNSGSPVGIVEEFISGEDLLTSTFPQTSLDKYLKTLWQIASGIADIHAVGIIHRDIKPNNMKLDGEGVIKIFDFGLARNTKSGAETVGFKGTLYFAAPELFAKGCVPFTKAVDMYAFGVTACYLADKKLPVEFKQAPPLPAPANTFASKPIDIPAELKTLFLSCLASHPEHRPNASTVRDMIARYLLKNKHQALAVYRNEPKYLNSSKKSVAMKLGNIGKIEIEYDGLRFYVKNVSGEVYINNQVVGVNNEIPDSCVVALGSPARHSSERAYITFDISHPEVVL